jgi:hypothetical protein
LNQLHVAPKGIASTPASGISSISSLRGVYARNSVYEGVTGWESFEPALSRVEQIALADLSRIASEIPEEWYGNDTHGLSRLIEALYRRRILVRELITGFRKSSRNPFPNWKDRPNRNSEPEK